MLHLFVPSRFGAWSSVQCSLVAGEQDTVSKFNIEQCRDIFLSCYKIIVGGDCWRLRLKAGETFSLFQYKIFLRLNIFYNNLYILHKYIVVTFILACGSFCLFNVIAK